MEDSTRGRQPKLRLRGTFIDTDDHQADIALSPRALSEPRRAVTKSDPLFDTEQLYVEQLDQEPLRRTTGPSGSDVAASPNVSDSNGRVDDESPRKVMEASQQAQESQRRPRSLERQADDEPMERFHSPDAWDPEVYASPGSSPVPYRPNSYEGKPPTQQLPTLPAQQNIQLQPMMGIAALYGRQPQLVPQMQANAAPMMHPALTQEALSRYSAGYASPSDGMSEVSCNSQALSQAYSNPPCRDQQTPTQVQQPPMIQPQMQQQMQAPMNFQTGPSQGPLFQLGMVLQPGQLVPSRNGGYVQEDAATTIGVGAGGYSAPSNEMQNYNPAGRRFEAPQACVWSGQSETTMSEPGCGDATSRMPVRQTGQEQNAPVGIGRLLAQRAGAARGGDLAQHHMGLPQRQGQQLQMQPGMQPGYGHDLPHTPSVSSRGHSNHRLGSDPGAVLYHKEELSTPYRGQNVPYRGQRAVSRQDLQCNLGASVQRMSEGWGSEHRRSKAIAVIEEIPRRIGDEMQRVASLIVDAMQSEVQTMSNIIRMQRPEGSGSSVTSRVVNNLEVIPMMVRNVLEARMETAKVTVRMHVQGRLQSVSMLQEGGQGDSSETLVRQAGLISFEVEQIAGDAVEAAARECLEHKTQQIDFALSDLARADREALVAAGLAGPSSAGSVGLEVGLQPERERPVRRPGSDCGGSMEQAQADMPQSLTNQTISDQLLRDKVRSGGQAQNTSLGMRSNQQMATNPGSVGHPDLCMRPCLYYTVGRCSNGQDCPFCHMPHHKRPLRLDKRHREMMKKMPFADLLQLMVPLLKQKVVDQLPGTMEEMTNGLDALSECAARSQGFSQGSEDLRSPSHELLHEVVERGRASSQVNSNSDVGSRDGGDSQLSRSQVSLGGTRRKSGFTGALQVMGSRMLLSLLARMAPVEAVEEKQIIDRILGTLLESGSEVQMEDDDEYQLWGSDVGLNRRHSDVGRSYERGAGSEVSGGPGPQLRPKSDIGFVSGGGCRQQTERKKPHNNLNQQAQQPAVGIAALMRNRGKMAHR